MGAAYSSQKYSKESCEDDVANRADQCKGQDNAISIGNDPTNADKCFTEGSDQDQAVVLGRIARYDPISNPEKKDRNPEDLSVYR